ncbi:MAG TPA: hypothetical protein VLE70_02780 [Anaerolineae bacterium]|nr:hypothetical protein [Anaerolineae bacterium]
MSKQRESRNARLMRLLLLLLLLASLTTFPSGRAEAVADIVESVPFHPFTMDAGNGTCLGWTEPGDPPTETRNCDPVNLFFHGLTVSEVSSRLQLQGWGSGGFGSTQQLHFGDETLWDQDLQLYLNETSTLRYHIRLWDAPGAVVTTTLGAVHHESGLFIHTIDMSWEESEAFVAGQLCGGDLTCQSSQVLGWQETIQSADDDNDGDPTTWREWDNNRQVTVISFSQFDTPPSVSIGRSAADVVLSWPAVENAVNYQIYRDTAPYFTPGTPLAITPTTVFTDTGIVDAGLDHYYLVTAVDALDRASPPSNQVGQVSLAVLPDWNLLSWPVLPADTALDAVLGNQLYGTHSQETADRVLVWSGDSQSYEAAWYCGGPICESWGEPMANHWLAADNSQSTLTLEPDSGFWIQNRSGITETLAVVGDVAEGDRLVPVGQNWQMLGSAFPVAKPLDSANLPDTDSDSPDTADRVLYWDAASQRYRSAWYCGGSICAGWGEPWANHWLAQDYSPTDIVLEPGHGFRYQNRHDGFVWLNLGN